MDDEFVRTVSVGVVRPYVLAAEIADGERRHVDIEPILDGEVLEPLRDPALFAPVSVGPDWGEIRWPNGADLAPAFLSYGPEGPPPDYYGGSRVGEEGEPLAAEAR